MHISNRPVVVSGGGPVGLTTGLLLSRFGVESLVVERSESPPTFPQGRNITTRSMEIFRYLGLSKEIESRALPAEECGAFRGPSLLSSQYDTSFRARKLPVSPCRDLVCSQDYLTEILWRAVRSDPRIQFATGASVNGFSEKVDHAEVLMTSGNGQEQPIVCDYLVVAEGARSATRGFLGIGRRSFGNYEPSVSILFNSPLREKLSGRFSVTYRINNDRFSGAIVAVDNDSRWILMTSLEEFSKFEDVGEDAGLLTVRAALGYDEVPVTLVDIRQWTPAAWIAEKYTEGRAMLVGDAAHGTLPIGGLGLNCGIQDALNLSWKLAKTIKGKSPDTLLGSYDTERRPVGMSTVLETVRCTIEQRRNISSDVLWGYNYSSSIVSPELEWRIGENSHLKVSTGRRFPHLWLDDPPNAHSTAIQAIGEFRLFSTENIPALTTFSSEAKKLGFELGGMLIGRSANRGQRDYGAALIRPDGHVAWCSPDTRNLTPSHVNGILRKSIGI